MKKSRFLEILKEEAYNYFNEMNTDIPGNSNKVFDINTVENDVDILQKGIEAPYVKVQHSTLGGDINVSILITVSLDDKKEWRYGILQNSRYFMMHLYNNGTLELFSANTSRQLKFRKTKVKSIEEVLTKINKYIKDVGSVTELISIRTFKRPIQEGVAETIAKQLGHKALFMMGAKNLMKGKESNGDEFLAFKIGRNAKSINVIKIIYNDGVDTYTVQFIRTRAGNVKIVKELDDIYFDQLHEVIENNTGLRLSLGGGISEYGSNKDRIPTKFDKDVNKFEKNINPMLQRQIKGIKAILDAIKPGTKEYQTIKDILDKAENEFIQPTQRQMDLISVLYHKSLGL